MISKCDFGKMGEAIACKYLIKNNYFIIDRNFYYKGGEIDIIAYDVEQNEISFFEVKTRSNKNYGLPYEAVDNTKIKHMIKGIKYYLHIKKWETKCIRVDIIEVYYIKDKFYINHIKQII